MGPDGSLESAFTGKITGEIRNISVTENDKIIFFLNRGYLAGSLHEVAAGGGARRAVTLKSLPANSYVTGFFLADKNRMYAEILALLGYQLVGVTLFRRE